MRYRPFGTSGFAASELGLGCWQLGGADWGYIDDGDALNIMRAAVETGVNFFDTADVYGLGRSETLIGGFLEICPETIFVATKLGRFPEPGWPANFTFEWVRRHTEASLRRLGVEALDLTQLHCIPTERLRSGEVFDWLRLLRQEGKIRQFGASVETVEEALICLAQPDLASLQVIFNIFRQKPASELFDEAKKRSVAVIVRLPLASGLLAGRFTHGTRFPETDHRSYNRDGQFFNVGETFAGLPFETGVELADRLRPMVPPGMSMGVMALRWCLDFGAVSNAIPGASTPGQVRENGAASDLPPLGDELHARLRSFYDREVAAHIRGPY